MKTSIILQAGDLLNHQLLSYSNYLLINPPVHDIRLPWGKWHQPMGLLQLAQFLKTNNKEVKLVDFLDTKKKRIIKRKTNSFEYGGYSLNTWQFGPSSEANLLTRLKNSIKNNWSPDVVFITSLNSIWWHGVKKTITQVRSLLPNTPIVVGGAYPNYATEHAKANSGADYIVTGQLTSISSLPPSLDFYENIPKSTGIFFYYINEKSNRTPRAIDDIIDEIKIKTQKGVLEFVFFDEKIMGKDIEYFCKLLEKIIALSIRTKIIMLGNLSPKHITKKLAIKMKYAGIKKIYLRSELDLEKMNDVYLDTLDDLQICVENLFEAGFKKRNGDISSMLPVGLPFENLENVTKRLIELSEIVGSVILVPFQYTPNTHAVYSFGIESIIRDSSKLHILLKTLFLTPDKFNGKLFPFAELKKYDFEDYVDLTRLAALLNSKYRGNTFDFMGDNIISKLLRESIRHESWNPFVD
jgi:hypothetical protein